MAITDADGTADNTLNTLFDPEVYVPTTPEDDDYNAVDFNLIDGDDLGDNEYAKQVCREQLIFSTLKKLKAKNTLNFLAYKSSIL